MVGKRRMLIVLAAVIIILLLILLYLVWTKKPGNTGAAGGLPIDYDLPILEGEGEEAIVSIDDPGLWEQVPELLEVPK